MCRSNFLLLFYKNYSIGLSLQVDLPSRSACFSKSASKLRADRANPLPGPRRRSEMFIPCSRSCGRWCRLATRLRWWNRLRRPWRPADCCRSCAVCCWCRAAFPSRRCARPSAPWPKSSAAARPTRTYSPKSKRRRRPRARLWSACSCSWSTTRSRSACARPFSTACSAICSATRRARCKSCRASCPPPPKVCGFLFLSNQWSLGQRHVWPVLLSNSRIDWILLSDCKFICF